jgi:hypothetical protein
MKSNLAYIGEAAQAALEAPRTTVTTQYVGGFPIVTQVERNSGHWEQSKRDYVQSAEILRNRLSQRNVTPIAIIPTAWWNAMTKESGLWTLRPDNEGTVGIDPSDAVEQAEKSKIPALLWVFGNAALVAGGALFYWDLPVTVSCIAMLYIIGVVATCGVTAALLGIFKKTGDRLNARWHAAVHVLRHGRAKVMGGMLVNEYRSHVRIAIGLPTPPADVVETLKRIAHLPNIKVAAEPGAVGFAKSPTTIISERILKNWDDERKEIERIRALDPIIYLEEGPAVAIVAQFGDFPIEKELVDRVVARQASLKG